MRFKAVASVLAAGLLASGCTAPTAAPTGARTSIVVAAYPLQFLAERIAGDTATITNLTPPGAEPHDLELTARQLATMAEADAVIYLPGFQAAVDQGVATAHPRLVIDADAGLELLAATEDGDDDQPGENGTSAHDPHVWLSPTNMITMAGNIESELSSSRPDLAATFAANTAALVADLKTLDADYAAGLKTCERREFITSHAAFAYLAKRYQLTQIPIAGLDPTVEPTATRIAEVQQLARSYGITTVFFETTISSAVATSLAGDLGLATAVLDPVESITDTSPGRDYLEVMKANLAALRKANQCQ